jgi:hypothetical protein
MGSDRLFRDHPPERRKRKRLISYVHPAIRRELKKTIDRFPEELHAEIKHLADEAGVSTQSIMCYALTVHMFAQPPAEQVRIIRETFPDADDAEIERAIAGLKRSLDAEIAANRKRKRS